MERISLVSILLFGVVVFSVAFLFWRYVWFFFRNPPRIVPAGTNIVSPADGTVVYVQDVEPGKPVIVVKQGISATIRDIAREDIRSSKVLIGVFMSPLDVHYNRAPLGGEWSSQYVIILATRKTCTWALCIFARCSA